ncbi:hypothetical protein PIB30_087380 [Stylosanthes scabra]|uniref:Uncharacterized protein n=1 Tax=Stylosanthes scabra TaxID=79078 RepID=A0ABU6RTB5_9FABA|nr:hypothetical protein [Stylosanthes scabra]
MSRATHIIFRETSRVDLIGHAERLTHHHVGQVAASMVELLDEAAAVADANECAPRPPLVPAVPAPDEEAPVPIALATTTGQVLLVCPTRRQNPQRF